MFTLHVPIQLPPGHSFFDNGQYPIPPLPGGLTAHSMENDDGPLAFSVSGFATEAEAQEFYRTLRPSLRWATLSGEHSMTVPVEDAVSAPEKMFEGTKPTVFKTGSSTRPYYMKVSQTNGLHISVLSNRIAAAMAKHVPNKLKVQPQIALALELFSEFQFGGTVPAQFMMLFTALEVMETKATKKRGPTIKRVKDALTKVGRTDAKAVGKQLDALYIARNDLIHEAMAVTDAQLAQLKTIVRDTLKAMLD